MKVKKIDKRLGNEVAVIDVSCLVEDHVIGAVNYDDGALEAMESKLTALTDIVSELVDSMVRRDIIPPKELQEIIEDYGVEYEHVKE